MGDVIYIRPKAVFVPYEHVRGVDRRATDLPILPDIDQVRTFMFGSKLLKGSRKVQGRRISYTESDDAKDIDAFMAQGVKRT